MLAIQFIKMYWEKENRTPEGSVMRRVYFNPEKIDASVILASDGADCFLQKRLYIQKDKVYTGTEYNKLFGNRWNHAPRPSEAKMQERKRQFLLAQNSMEKDNLGLFYADVKHIDIPGIEIIKEKDDYRIRWY